MSLSCKVLVLTADINQTCTHAQDVVFPLFKRINEHKMIFFGGGGLLVLSVFSVLRSPV